MRSYGYKSLEDWRKDRLKLTSHSNDEKFLKKVTAKIMASEPDLKVIIIEELMDHMMDQNPLEFIKFYQRHLAQDNLVVIKSKIDPYFEV